MMDQADMLIDFNFPTVMILPQKEIANQAGLATGIRLFAERLRKPIVLYLKHDRWLAPRAVQSLEDDGLISWVKYAVVRDDPAKDDYLREIAQVVDPNRIVSGIGEQPAIVHMRDFGVASFTSGCVCVAPKMSMRMLAAVAAKDYAAAELLRTRFQALEDLRNQIQPISVLHQAVAAAGIAETGPIQPMLGSLTADQAGLVAQASRELRLAEIEL
jgi:dihydrodipicolinate synthase/N-acetylneuraminate lyase